MKKITLFICFCLMLFYYFKPSATIIIDKYYVDKLGNNDVDWLFFSTSSGSNDY
jgi:hypothetical protein